MQQAHLAAFFFYKHDEILICLSSLKLSHDTVLKWTINKPEWQLAKPSSLKPFTGLCEISECMIDSLALICLLGPAENRTGLTSLLSSSTEINE